MNGVDNYYLDTSALLPYYREEASSRQVESLLIKLKPPLLISDLTLLEFASALSRWVRMNELSETQASLLENTFSKDIQIGLFLKKPIVHTHYEQAEKWLLSRRTALRTLDALHMACCWHSGAVLITSDKILSQSAVTIGINHQLI